MYICVYIYIYWVAFIIPIDELHHFSEGWPNHQPENGGVYHGDMMGYHRPPQRRIRSLQRVAAAFGTRFPDKIFGPRYFMVNHGVFLLFYRPFRKCQVCSRIPTNVWTLNVRRAWRSSRWSMMTWQPGGFAASKLPMLPGGCVMPDGTIGDVWVQYHLSWYQQTATRVNWAIACPTNDAWPFWSFGHIPQQSQHIFINCFLNVAATRLFFLLKIIGSDLYLLPSRTTNGECTLPQNQSQGAPIKESSRILVFLTKNWASTGEMLRSWCWCWLLIGGFKRIFCCLFDVVQWSSTPDMLALRTDEICSYWWFLGLKFTPSPADNLSCKRYGFDVEKPAFPDANHGAGIFTNIETPKITQSCR